MPGNLVPTHPGRGLVWLPATSAFCAYRARPSWQSLFLVCSAYVFSVSPEPEPISTCVEGFPSLSVIWVGCGIWFPQQEFIDNRNTDESWDMCTPQGQLNISWCLLQSNTLLPLGFPPPDFFSFQQEPEPKAVCGDPGNWQSRDRISKQLAGRGNSCSVIHCHVMCFV